MEIDGYNWLAMQVCCNVEIFLKISAVSEVCITKTRIILFMIVKIYRKFLASFQVILKILKNLRRLSGSFANEIEFEFCSIRLGNQIWEEFEKVSVSKSVP